MKITAENLGILKKASLETGDFTVICGGNNTGKTYVSYALYGFLHTWKSLVDISTVADNKTVASLLEKGIIRINLEEYIKKSEKILAACAANYKARLPKIFAARESYFENTRFALKADIAPEVIRQKEYISNAAFAQSVFIDFSKKAGSHVLEITQHYKDAGAERSEIPHRLIRRIIADCVAHILLAPFLPRPFIASDERTGTVIFQKELDFARDRLLEEMRQIDDGADRMELLLKSSQGYAAPVKMDVDFIRAVKEVDRQESFLAREHPQALADFAKIAGGEYIVSQNGAGVYFKPFKSNVRLTMGESSGAVRSLLDINFYLRNIAKPNDLLMIDEPELNLHPVNQCRMARLLARLVSLGIKVFITTHSDYIIKELNTLIMLNEDTPHLRKIRKAEGYHAEELIAHDKVKAYIAKTDLIQLEDNARRRRHHALVPVEITPEYGMGISSFDETIDDMNRVQDDILYGD